ncbi:MFS transporter [Isoptericola sp. 4D.3]|uniref:MFS transporter n=1 Tax=Isoptericola peretonis TaxID=2918523 RepID=A0ABT0J7C5_9MICO|nr:MFS transporter [Isoptericola sp. 4D.3]
MRRPLLTLTAFTFLTWVGARITAVALPLVALAETGEAWATGLVGGMSGLPLLTVGWWGRGLRERLVTGRALAAVMLVQAAGLAIVPLAALGGHVEAVSLCASGLVTGVAAALLGPAERALVADLAEVGGAAGFETAGGTPARWLAWQDLAHRVSMIFAPPLGAWLVVGWGPGPLLWCQTAVVLGCAGAMLAVPGAGGRAPATGDVARPARVGVVLRAHPQVAVGVVTAGVGGLCWFGFTLGLAVLGVEHGRPGALIAAGMSGYGAASVAASLVAPLLVDRLPRLATAVGTWAVLGLAFAALPVVVPNLVGVALVSALGGAATPWGIAALNALISERTSGADRRAAFTAETVLHSGGASLGLLVGGALIGWFGAGPVLVATGAVQVAAAVVGLLVAWRLGARRPAARPAGQGRVAPAVYGRRRAPRGAPAPADGGG